MNIDQMKQMITGNTFVNANDIEILMEEDSYITKVHLHENHKNPYGPAHGGLIYTMADAAAGFASCQVAELPVTLHSDFHFISNVKEGTITARSKVLQKGGRVILLDVKVTSDSGKLLASGTFTYYDAARK